MKNIFKVWVVLCLLMSFQQAEAQKSLSVKIQGKQILKEPDVKIDDFGYSGIIGVNDDAYYVRLEDEDNNFIVLEKYSLDFKLEKSVKYETGLGDLFKGGFGKVKTNRVLSTIKTDDGIVMLVASCVVTLKDKAKGDLAPSSDILLLKYDNDLNTNTEPEKLGVLSTNGDKDGWVIGLIESPDKSKILFYQAKDEGGSKCSLLLRCYNNKMTQQWQKEVVIPYACKLVKHMQTNFDNNGDVAYLSMVYNEKAKAKNGGFFHVITLTDNGKTFNEGIIGNDENFLQSPSVGFNKKGFFAVGNYSLNLGNTVKGTYIVTADRALKNIQPIKFSEFSVDFITQYEKKGAKEKAAKNSESGNEAEIEDLISWGYIEMTNGNIVFLGCQYLYMVKENTPFLYAQCFTSTCYSPDGEVVWRTKIPRKARYDGMGVLGPSAIVLLPDDNIAFVYSDSEDNFNTPEDGSLSWANTKAKVGIIVIVDQNGEKKKEIVLTKEQLDMIGGISRAIKLDNTTYLSASTEKREIRFIKYEFKL